MMTFEALLENIANNTPCDPQIVLTDFKELDSTYSEKILVAFEKRKKIIHDIDAGFTADESRANRSKYIRLHFLKIDFDRLQALMGCVNALCGEPYYIRNVDISFVFSGFPHADKQELVKFFSTCIGMLNFKIVQQNRCYHGPILVVNGLHSHQFSFDEVMNVMSAIANNVSIRYVDLRSNGFEQFAFDQKLAIVKCLLGNLDLNYLLLDGNGFEKEALEFLDRLPPLLSQHQGMTLELIRMDWHNFRVGNRTEESDAQSFRLLKIYLYLKKLSGSSNEAVYQLRLTTEEYKSLFTEFHNTCVNNIISTWMTCDTNLDSKAKGEIDAVRLFHYLTQAQEDQEKLYLITVNLHAFDDEELKILTEKLKNRKVNMRNIIVDLTNANPARVDLLCNCVNVLLMACNESSSSVCISDNNLTVGNHERITRFIQHLKVDNSLNIAAIVLKDSPLAAGELGFRTLISITEVICANISIVDVDFSGMHLAQFGERLLEFAEVILARSGVKKIGLTNNALSTLNRDLFFRLVARFSLHDRIEGLNIMHNNITGLPLEEIEDMFSILKPRLGQLQTDIWTKEEFLQLFERENAKAGFRMGKVWMQSEINSSGLLSLYWATDGNNLYPGFLQESEIYQLLKEAINLMRNNPLDYRQLRIGYWVSQLNNNLRYEWRLDLAWLAFKNLDNVVARDYHLSPEDGLKLFLARCEKDHDDFDPFLLRQFELYDTPLSASRFFTPWQALADIEHEDYDAMADVLKDTVLSALFQAEREVFPKVTLYRLCMNTLKRRADNIVNSFEAMKFVNMTKWFAYACVMLTCTDPKKLAGFEKVFKEILEYPDPQFRFEVTHMLFNDVIGKEQGRRIYQCVNLALRKPYLLLAGIPLSAIIIGADEKEIKEAEMLAQVTRISKLMTRIYKDGYYFAPFLSALRMLAKVKIPSMVKFGIILQILSVTVDNRNESARNNLVKKMQLQKASFGLIQGLGGLNDLEGLGALVRGDFNVQQAAIFKQYFDVTAEQFQYFAETIAVWGLVPEIFCYFSKIRSLPSQDRALMEPVFTRYVRSILSLRQKDFEDMRYSETESPHLKVIFKDRPALKTVWTAGVPREDFQEFVRDNKVEAEAEVINHREIIENALAHRHLNAAKFKVLCEYLGSPAAKQILLKEQARKDLNERKRLAARKPDNANNAHTDENKAIAYLEVELHLMELLALDANDKTSQLRCLRVVRNKIAKFCVDEREFLHDLNMMIEKVLEEQRPRKQVTLQGYQIGVTGDYLTTFRAGSVPGSCQRIEGTPNLNKGLMGIVMGGHNLLIVMWDTMGTLVSRVILRMLRDTVLLKPVLFLEQMYPAMLAPLWRNALKTMAILMAKFTKLTLLSLKREKESRQYPHPVESLGNIAPYGYEDALYGIQKGDIYTIPRSYVIYSPHEENLENLKSLLKPLLPHQATNKTNVIDTILAYYDEEGCDIGLLGNEVPPESRVLYFKAIEERRAKALLSEQEKNYKVVNVYHV